MKKTVNWGILGPGRIAEKFADAFNSSPGAKLVAVASSDPQRGKAFAAKHRIPKVHNDYASLAADPEVDIVYIATPHSFHYQQTLLCLKHKKAVLCEKPLTVDYASAAEMVNLARVNKTFLMEGMWSRFFPATIKTFELVKSGVIGEVRFLNADFGFVAPYDLEGRVYNKALAGGAQYDVGVYPLFLALLLFGKPLTIQALAQLAPTGVDQTTSVQFTFENGHMAHILSSVVVDTPKEAVILGTTGTITLHSPWHKSQAITVKNNQGETKRYDFPYPGIGFEFQLRHATECMQNALLESPLMSLELSLLMAEVADEILKQGGVQYPRFS